MAKATRRGPKKGKRLTSEIQAEIIVEALYSKKTVEDVLEKYKKSGYNVKEDVEKDLKNLGPVEMTFMLGNKHILESVKEEAVKTIISDITKNKKALP